MNSPPTTPPARPVADPAPGRWQRTGSALVHGFHAYAGWLVSISWWRFIVLSILLLVGVGILTELPPFTWTITERVETSAIPPPKPPPPVPPTGAQGGREPLVRIDRPKGDSTSEGVDISVGEHGIRITARGDAPQRAADAASAAAEAASAAASAAQGVSITLPPGVASDAVRDAVEQARRDIEDAVRQAREDAEEAARDAEEARRDAEAALAELGDAPSRTTARVTRYSIGDGLKQLTFVWIIASMILKIVYKGRIQAEAKAAQATETAEAESLRRQVVEARLAAMQAQVEPHFLFNTLASIDHLIETDPVRASQMQKHLIALLRASMPTLRETQAQAVRELGREMAVVRPYLELLKMRMEDRLQVDLCVPGGLLTAEFPPMMLQTLVENAVRHGLEPKPEGGTLRVCAEVVDGRLEVVVADSGVGFGAAATAGTGVGLENIRERLALLYGTRASLTVAETPGGGTTVTIAVPYVARAKDAGA